MNSRWRMTRPAHVLAASLILFAVGKAEAAPFPARGDDTTQSLGEFFIKVAPAFQPMLAAAGLPTSGNPSYDKQSHIFQSPYMYDPATVIGRSDPFPSRQPGGPDFTGAVVGTAGTIVTDQNFIDIGKFLPGLASGTNEVHTELRSLNATAAGGWVLRAGSGMGLPVSPGEVESNSGPSGNPNKDFPAQSFFDVFVEIDVPGLGTLFNKDALFVTQMNISGFPPTGLVYVHDKTSPVEVFLRTEGGPVDFGTMYLAGHGVGLGNDPHGQSVLNSAIPEPSSIVLFGSGFVGWMGLTWMRRRSRR